MENFAKNVAFAVVDMFQMLETDVAFSEPLILKTMSLVAAGALRPARPVKSFKASEVEDSLRYLQSGKHWGKVVVEMNDEDPLEVSPYALDESNDRLQTHRH